MEFLCKHGINFFFFKLCAFDFGRVMNVDSCTVDRDRLDYARILLATNSLTIINDSFDILVDDMLMNIKIVEEWGYEIGEDVCLFENDSENEAECETCEKVDEHATFAVNKDTDNMVNDMAAEWGDDDHLKDKVVSNNDAHGGDDTIVSKQRSPNVNNGTTEASFSNAASLDTVMEKSSTSKIVGVRSDEGWRDEGNLEDGEVGPTHFLAHTNNVLFPVTKECKVSVWGSSDDRKGHVLNVLLLVLQLVLGRCS